MAKGNEVAPVDMSALMERLRAEGFTPDIVIDPTEIQDFQLTDKDELVNRPFIIVQVLAKKSLEFKSDYVVCRCLDGAGNRLVFADGSTGIAATLLELLTKYEHLRKPLTDDEEGGWLYNVAIPVTKGLSKNTYQTRVVNERTGEKETTQATTYRLNVGQV